MTDHKTCSVCGVSDEKVKEAFPGRATFDAPIYRHVPADCIAALSAKVAGLIDDRETAAEVSRLRKEADMYRKYYEADRRWRAAPRDQLGYNAGMDVAIAEAEIERLRAPDENSDKNELLRRLTDLRASLAAAQGRVAVAELERNDARTASAAFSREVDELIKERDRALEQIAVKDAAIRKAIAQVTELDDAHFEEYGDRDPEDAPFYDALAEITRGLQAALSTTGGGLIGALREIAEFGSKNTGYGWTCSEKAKRALAGVGL